MNIHEQKEAVQQLEDEIDQLFDKLKRSIYDVTVSRRNWLAKVKNWLGFVGKSPVYRQQYPESKKGLSLHQYAEIKGLINGLEGQLNELSTIDQTDKYIDDILDAYRDQLKTVVRKHADAMSRGAPAPAPTPAPAMPSAPKAAEPEDILGRIPEPEEKAYDPQRRTLTPGEEGGYFRPKAAREPWKDIEKETEPGRRRVAPRFDIRKTWEDEDEDEDEYEGKDLEDILLDLDGESYDSQKELKRLQTSLGLKSGQWATNTQRREMIRSELQKRLGITPKKAPKKAAAKPPEEAEEIAAKPPEAAPKEAAPEELDEETIERMVAEPLVKHWLGSKGAPKSDDDKIALGFVAAYFKDLIGKKRIKPELVNNPDVLSSTIENAAEEIKDLSDEDKMEYLKLGDKMFGVEGTTKGESIRSQIDKYKKLLREEHRPEFLQKQVAKLPISEKVNFYREKLASFRDK